MIRWNRMTAVGLMACALLGAARATNAQGVTLGFKLGPTFSNVDSADDEDTNTLTSFGGGGFLRFGLGSIALQAELLALTKGAQMEEPGEDVEVKFDYIEVPLMLHFGLSQGAISPYVLVGPTFGFEIGCEVEGTIGVVEVSADCEDVDIGLDDRKDIDIGIAGALGLAFAAGPGSVLLEGRYTYGLTDVTDDEDTDPKHRSIAAFVGYSIPLGRR